MNIRPSALAAVFALLPALLAAGPAVTVYNSDLAVVREQRGFQLQKGVQDLRFDGVAARLDPTSVRLEGEGLRLLEQDYDYDLASPDRVLEKYVDQTLKAVGKGGQAYSGQLLSYTEGQLLLRGAGGQVLMLNRAELASLDFPSLPGGLLTKPTLLWKLDAEKAGRLPLTVTYLTGGLSWHAEYVAVLGDDDRTVGLNGWVSVDNQSGATFEDANLKLIAGDIHRAAPPPRPMLMKAAAMDLAAAPAASAFQERGFADYHLYALAWPVTLRQAQVKQVQLFSVQGVNVKKQYTFDAEQLGPKVAVTLALENKKVNGLGLPLPAGQWRVFKADTDGARELAGEDRSDHTAVDETVHLTLGSAFDVVGQRTVLFEEPDTRGRASLRKVKLELRNHKQEPVTVLLREHAWGQWTVDDDQAGFKRKDAGTFEAEVSVPASGTKDWEYTVRMKD